MQSKIAFAGVCDELGIPQPAWHEVHCEVDLDWIGYLVWVKAVYSTAGRGVVQPERVLRCSRHGGS